MNKIHIEKVFAPELPNLKDVEMIPCDVGCYSAGRTMSDARVCKKALVDWTSMLNLSELLESWNLKNVTFGKSEILKYEVGGYFVKHLDTLHGPHHVGTLLIIFPSENMKGGELFIDNKYNRCNEIQNTEITVSHNLQHAVYIPLGTFHRVAPILEGCRTVFKTAIFCKNFNYSMVSYRDSGIDNKEMEPESRIIISTGRRLPTTQEFEERIKNIGDNKRRGIIIKNMYGEPFGMPQYKD